jgi:uncharacterized protein YqfA (UPF0365 family)
MQSALPIVLAAPQGLELWLAAAVAGLFALAILAVGLAYGPLWYWAYRSGAPVSLMSLIGMSLRGTKPWNIVRANALAVQAGLPDITTRRLESHQLCGGDALALVEFLVDARRLGKALDFDQARLLDLQRCEIIPLKEFGQSAG